MTVSVDRRRALGLLVTAPAALWANSVQSGTIVGAAPARSSVGVDGVWRWADGREVALFGVNYNIASASAFRFAKATGIPFEQIVDTDFSHFKRLGFTALRLSYWGDWESSSANGSLVENEHLAVLDMVVARASESGISCLLSPIVTYDASWPDALGRPRTGLSHTFDKDILGTDGAAITAEVRYIGALLARVNQRTGRRLADEPSIVAVEPINEPTHHAGDRAGSVRYINSLAKAVRDSGFSGPIFYNVTQDMAMAGAIAAANVQGATFAWNPTGLRTGRAVASNGLLLVEGYRQFDAADTMGRYFYPAMVREFRAGGAQYAAMFAYYSMAIAASNSD